MVTFYCLGLRVSELCGLTVQDTNLDRGCTWIKGKGRKERELVPLPQLVVTALHFSRHKTLATMLIYRDEHDREATQRTLADVVASTL